jgi:hypothetical protein
MRSFSNCQVFISFLFIAAAINPAIATPIAIVSPAHVVDRGMTDHGHRSGDPDGVAKGLACFFTMDLLNECKS